jgi:hypothetical protein
VLSARAAISDITARLRERLQGDEAGVLRGFEASLWMTSIPVERTYFGQAPILALLMIGRVIRRSVAYQANLWRVCVSVGHPCALGYQFGWCLRRLCSTALLCLH